MIKGITGMAVSALLSACSPVRVKAVEPLITPTPSCDYAELSDLPKLSTVPEEYNDAVAFVKDVRAFGVEKLGLYSCSTQYTTFKLDEQTRTLYRLFVTKGTSLPNTWREAIQFFQHDTTYRDNIDAGYFVSFEDTLEDESEYYIQQGYNVYVRNVTNYVLQGEEGSSITPSLVALYNRKWLVHTIFHEICHDTTRAMVGNLPAEIDEPYCMLFGYAGAAEYFKVKNGVDSQEYTEAMQSFADYEDRAVKITRSYQQLQELYTSQKPAAQKQQERDLIFIVLQEALTEEMDNARLWDKYPYAQHYPLMLRLYNNQDKNLRQTLKIMKGCPREEEKALKYIQEMIKKNN